MKKTKANIIVNKNAAIAVWDKKMSGYNLVGQAKYYSKGEYVAKVKSLKENKEMPAKGAIIFTIKDTKKSC